MESLRKQFYRGGRKNDQGEDHRSCSVNRREKKRITSANGRKSGFSKLGQDKAKYQENRIIRKTHQASFFFLGAIYLYNVVNDIINRQYLLQRHNNRNVKTESIPGKAE